MRRDRVLTVEQGQEETVVERTLRTYPLAILGSALAALWCLYCWTIGDLLGMSIALLSIAVVLVVASYVDPMLQIVLRWSSVARDFGLVASFTGVPDLHWWALRRSTVGLRFRISGLAFEPDDVIALEDRIAKGFGYASGLVEECTGTVRKSRRGYQISLSRFDGLLEAFPLGERQVGYSINDTPLVIGRGKNMQVIEWNPLETAGHLILQGETRSGKSVLTYSLLAQLAPMVDVVVRGIDPTGILAKPWKQGRWVTGTRDMTRVAELLEEEVEEMDCRNAELAVRGWDKITQVSQMEPLRVIVLEEYAAIMEAAGNEDSKEGRQRADRVKPRIESAVARLVAEGAKAGMRVFLLTQRASSNVINTDARGNFAIRITLRVGSREAVKMLHDGLDESWLKTIQQYKNGVGIVDLPGEKIQKFRAVYIGDAEYDRYLVAVGVGRDLALSRGGVLAELRR
ncbi:FtsK/SpoIIIE domain-containing protein [Tsukamurella sp. PLM1]|uniref:FtsK/SpoIIIE domain-containing protein n=1 Tax=Tsukamurella sp. PLM1 TaxID=2929795 RepID=UPI0020630020|nr:FtsK/SpoIIIE domain-containing protein [Tsukamurella sp. PLM1]BDH56696.1 hypothetical protein MTP03_16350 [Tsukamurella sp. PLM1]